MIDTTDPTAVELALTYCQGKAIINSINLEDRRGKVREGGADRARFWRGDCSGCIDEDPKQAQAFTRERKLAIAQRSYELLTKKYGMAPEDIVFDPLVFPCATGDKNYIGARWKRWRNPADQAGAAGYANDSGISNVSFGLPGARARW